MIDHIMKRCFGFIRKKPGYLVFPLVWSAMICQPVHGLTVDAILAWGKMEKHGSNIYFSQRTHQKWSEPKRLSFSDKSEILPTLASNTKDEIWVVWTELNNLGGKLQFRHYQNGEWGLPRSIKTHSTSDMAPSAIVDANGDTWLVWSGTDQTDDDIFYSTWKNGHWTSPLRVNTDDNWPDILPQLSLTSTGMPRVTWSGYDGKKYSTFYSHWTGTNWGPEKVSDESVGHLSDSMAKSAGTDMAAIISDLPDFVTDINQATIHFRRQGKANTIRLGLRQE